MQRPSEHAPHLLLADDEEDFRLLTTSALEEEGYIVTSVSNGQAAVDAACKCSFDVALLDVKMPKVDGLEVLRILRSEHPQMECMMMTGFQDINLAIEALKLGAKEFLMKPLNVNDLISRLRSILRAQQAEARLKHLQTEFSSRLLHDLLVPLHSIKSAIGFLQMETIGSVSPQQKNILHTIETTVKNMDGLLSNMIDLSLFESGRVDIEKIPTNLDDLVPAVCTNFKSQINVKRISLKLDVHEDIPTIALDPDRIEQVFSTLMENALAQTPEGGTITVRVTAEGQSAIGEQGECVQIEVSDTGPGIAPVDLPLIFDKYKEVLTGKPTANAGVGLGLAISRSVVEAHGGTMSAQSTIGGGSTFIVRLPVSISAVA